MSSVFLLITFSGFSQYHTVSGVITDTASLPIPFVNIGLLTNNVGTISNINGLFQLEIPDSIEQANVVFSHVSFDKRIISIGDTADTSLHVRLYSTPKLMPPITIDAKRAKLKSQGTKVRNPILYGNVAPAMQLDIIEFAKKIEVNHPILLKKAAIFLKEVKFDSVMIRLNFYHVNENGPGNRIITEEVRIYQEVKKGWFEVNLEVYEIEISEDFYVGFEYIPTVPINKPHSIFYGAKLGGHAFTRNTSLGGWNKVSGATLSAYVDYWK